MVNDFIQQWYVDPVIYGTGYNPVNTVTYGILLILSLIGIYFVLKKFNVEINKKFFLSLVPFVFFGAMLRAYEDLLETMGTDLGIFTVIAQEGPRNMFLVSPIIYITIFLVAFSALVISLGLSKVTNIRYDKILFSIGSLLSLGVLAMIVPNITDYFAAGVMVTLATGWVVVLFGFRKYVAPKYEKLKNTFTKMNTLIIAAHMFDASTTFTALSYYSYFEQHFLPRFIISFLGPSSMFLLKLAFVPLALYYIDKEVEQKERRILFKLLVLILGLGPGLRNFFRLIMGV
jgi:uncharacterized membrane protein